MKIPVYLKITFNIITAVHGTLIRLQSQQMQLSIDLFIYLFILSKQHALSYRVRVSFGTDPQPACCQAFLRMLQGTYLDKSKVTSFP